MDPPQDEKPPKARISRTVLEPLDGYFAIRYFHAEEDYEDDLKERENARKLKESLKKKSMLSNHSNDTNQVKLTDLFSKKSVPSQQETHSETLEDSHSEDSETNGDNSSEESQGEHQSDVQETDDEATVDTELVDTMDIVQQEENKMQEIPKETPESQKEIMQSTPTIQPQVPRETEVVVVQTVVSHPSKPLVKCCANVKCHTQSTPLWRKGWELENGEKVTLCNNCGLRWKNGHYCQFCNQIYRQGEKDDGIPWIQCDGCKFWTHIRCDKSIDEEKLDQDDPYFCLKCRNEVTKTKESPSKNRLDSWLVKKAPVESHVVVAPQEQPKEKELIPQQDEIITPPVVPVVEKSRSNVETKPLVAPRTYPIFKNPSDLSQLLNNSTVDTVSPPNFVIPKQIPGHTITNLPPPGPIQKLIVSQKQPVPIHKAPIKIGITYPIGTPMMTTFPPQIVPKDPIVEPVVPSTKPTEVPVVSPPKPKPSDSSSPGVKKGKKTDSGSKQVLMAWLNAHSSHPYPTDVEKEQLAQESEMNITQVNNWFVNARRRYWNKSDKVTTPQVVIPPTPLSLPSVLQDVDQSQYKQIKPKLIKRPREIIATESDKESVTESESSLSQFPNERDEDVICSVLDCHRVGSKGLHLLKCETKLREPNSSLICHVHYQEDLKKYREMQKSLGVASEDFYPSIPRKRKKNVPLVEDEIDEDPLPEVEFIDPVTMAQNENKEPEFSEGCVRLKGFTPTELRDFKLKDQQRLKRRITRLSKINNLAPVETEPVKRRTGRGEESSYTTQDTTGGMRTRKECIRLARSGIHSWGLFCSKPIAANDIIIEYIGEIIRNSLLDIREKEYESIGSDYFFRMDDNWSLDATVKGGIARFINHSCDPNCYCKVLNINGQSRVFVYALRDINVGEELSYDYKFDFEVDPNKRIPCRCGTRKCKGFLNWDKNNGQQ